METEPDELLPGRLARGGQREERGWGYVHEHPAESIESERCLVLV